MFFFTPEWDESGDIDMISCPYVDQPSLWCGWFPATNMQKPN